MYHLEHRVAIAIVSGEWPNGEVDHINGIRHDNRLCNLRVVTKCENLRNKGKYRSNTSGRVGVHWHKQHRKWSAVIAGRTIGVFKNIEDAIAARELAEKECNYHENHGSNRK